MEKPAIISGFNNGLLKKWLVERLEGRARLIDDYNSGKTLKEAALAYRPDILIIMRIGEDRGLPEADELAQWGLDNGFKVVLIIGESDLEWEAVGSRIKDAGGYVIGWGKGEERSSFYMMNIVMSVIKELAEVRDIERANGVEKHITQTRTRSTYAEPLAPAPQRLTPPPAPESVVKELPSEMPSGRKVLLATGHPPVDQEIKLLLPRYGLGLAGECYDRRVIDKMTRELDPGLAVISPYLGGEGDLIAIIRSLREKGVRVVVLPGDAKAVGTGNMVRELIPLGVYDFVFDQVTAPEVLERLQHPARLGDITRILSEPVAVTKGVAEESLADLYETRAGNEPGFLDRLKNRLNRKKGAPPAQTAAEPPPAATPKESLLKKTPPIRALPEESPPKARPASRRVKPVAPPFTPMGEGFCSAGAIAFVSPWQPGLAGRLTAAAAEMFAGEERVKVAIIGASGYSTMAGRLGIEDDELIMSDWRIPGSHAPVIRGGLRIWAVDPSKSLNIYNDEEMGLLIARAQSDYPRVIIDCADEHNLARELLYQNVSVMYIIPGVDPVEQSTALLWLNTLRATGKTVACGIDLRHTAKPVPEGLKPELVIRGSPEEDLWRMMRKTVNPSLSAGSSQERGQA